MGEAITGKMMEGALRNIKLRKIKAGAAEELRCFNQYSPKILNCQLAPGVYADDVFELTNAALFFLAIARRTFREEGEILTITSLISDRKNVQAKSRTHEEGRAFDIRTIGVKKSTLEKLKAILEGEICRGIGALVEVPEAVTDGIVRVKYVERPIVGEPHGNGPHWHIQVRKEADLFKNF